METEFAGCLLMVGPPDVIGSGGDEVRSVRLVPVDEDYEIDVCGKHADERVREILDGPVSSLWYRTKCKVWWEEHVWATYLPHRSIVLRREFDSWWRDYKLWLLENQRGS